MHKKTFFVPLLMLLVAGPGLVGFGASLDEAKERLAAKKYDQVDEILQDELAKPAPAAAALKISLAAALKSGRYVTAQKRITKLLQVTRNQDRELIFQGAEIAAKSGNDRLAMTRYLMYSRFFWGREESQIGAVAALSVTAWGSSGGMQALHPLVWQHGRRLTTGRPAVEPAV